MKRIVVGSMPTLKTCRFVVSRFIVGTAVVLLSCGCAYGANKQIILKSSEVEFGIDSARGSIVRIANRQTKEVYPVSKDNCQLKFDSGIINLNNFPLHRTSKTASSCKFAGKSGSVEIVKAYNLDSSKAYINRDVSVKNIGKSPVYLRNVTDCSMGFKKPFESYLFHRDVLDKPDAGTERCSETETLANYRSSINVFMRGKSGGLCIGVKYPFFQPTLTNGSVDVAYETNMRINPGKTLQLPTAYFGVYKNLGYKVRKEMNWTPRVLVTEQEEMDLGEVRAMQKIMRDHLPEYSTGHKGYFFWLNAWWANRNLQGKIGDYELAEYKKIMVSIKQSKCIDLLGIAPVWCGWAGYIADCPEIDAIGPDAKFPMNPYIENLMAAAHEQKIPISGFCEGQNWARHYRKDRPDWPVQPTEDPTKLLNSRCQANDEYSDWFYRLICSAIDTNKLGSWSWDFGWFREPMICYGKTHGHELGNCEFQEYRNVTGVIQKMRKRFPNLFIEIYWGLKEAGPWSLRGLNSLENAYENDPMTAIGLSAADDMRFQHWYNHNYRFLPTYMNLAQMNMTKEKNGHLYSLLSCLGSSSHGSLADWIAFETDAQADEIFGPLRKWKAWASENMPYLKDRVDLFGQPARQNGIDGSAHIIKDRGYIFVFNPWGETYWGSIPLDGMVNLTKAGNYSFTDISGDQAKQMGVYAKGDSFVFSIPAKSAMVIKLVPTTEQVSKATVPEGTAVQPAFKK